MEHESLLVTVLKIILLGLIAIALIIGLVPLWGIRDATVKIKDQMVSPSSMSTVLSYQMAAMPDTAKVAALDAFIASALVQSKLPRPIECEPLFGSGCPYGTCVCEYYSPINSRACPVGSDCPQFERACGTFGSVCPVMRTA